MDHTKYTNKLLTEGSNGAVPAAGDNLNDSIGAEENRIQLHHHHNHHQISYDSVWPNFPLQLVHHNQHQVPPSSSSDQIHHHPYHHHDHQLVLAARNYSNFMDQDQNQLIEDQEDEEEEEEEELGAMKEMMYRIAAMQPVDIDPATIRKPKRRNVRISEDPQSVAARHRRERISEKIRILQRLVPGGTKMDTASMLDEAIRYVKFLKRQIRLLQQQHSNPHQSHPQCININTASASGGGAIDWPLLPPPQPPIRGNSVITSSSSDTRPDIRFAAFGGG